VIVKDVVIVTLTLVIIQVVPVTCHECLFRLVLCCWELSMASGRCLVFQSIHL